MLENPNRKIFVAMSGGVDSSVAAALMKRAFLDSDGRIRIAEGRSPKARYSDAGFKVVGVFMKPWQSQSAIVNRQSLTDCLWKEDREDALRVAAKLDIPLLTWDFSKEYEKYVVRYMIEGYRKGITPNPDVMCNKFIKFGLFLDKALEAGADYIATGHYVRLEVQAPRGSNSARSFSGSPAEPSDSDSATSRKRLGGTFDEKVVGRFASLRSDRAKTASESARRTTPARLTYYKLLKAKDLNKDQSYFLYTLIQKQLKHCLFPIGDYTKPEVRKMAKKFGLPNWDKKDSQGICFVGPLNVDEFLKKYIRSKRGLVLSKSDGKILGEHDGVWFYTIGQRHGIRIARLRPEGLRQFECAHPNESTKPYYVVDKDIKSNILYVDGLEIQNSKFKNQNDPFDKTQGHPERSRTDDKSKFKSLQIKEFNWINRGHKSLPLDCRVKTRYRQKELDCTILKNGLDKALIEVKEGSIPIAPGQSAVFYKGSEVLGGGIIT